VVWEGRGGQDGSDAGIFGQRYASSGAPLGLEFRVNTYTSGSQRLPSVAMDSAGNFVVVWDSSPDGYLVSLDIFGQRYASSGAPLGPEFRANTYTTGVQKTPGVAMDPSGNFIMVWESVGQDGSSFGVFGQRYASSGAPLGPEFRVNTYTTNYQFGRAVAMDAAGNFVIAWTSFEQDGSLYGVFAQRYASSGAPLGPEFRVNTWTTLYQANASVAMDPSGNFVVVWDSTQDGSVQGIFGQRYASSGTPLGSEFRVNTHIAGTQRYPSVASDPAGNFVVVWQSYVQDGSSYSVYGQRYASSGAPEGPEFRVNTFTTVYQGLPAVASDPTGNFVVVWHDNVQDGSGFGVFGQRYAQIVPVELMGFGVE